MIPSAIDMKMEMITIISFNVTSGGGGGVRSGAMAGVSNHTSGSYCLVKSIWLEGRCIYLIQGEMCYV